MYVYVPFLYVKQKQSLLLFEHYREHYLEKIAIYLSRCGLQSNSELVEKGYPDLGWDPVEGERYLDFLRFCVWVNGKVNLINFFFCFVVYKYDT